MMKIYCGWRVTILLFCYCSQMVASASAQQAAGQVTIPEELSHATEFVHFLQRQGLVIREVARSHREAMLGGCSAAFIRTDRGVVEVAFIPDAEKISIVYSRNGSTVVPHRYVINAAAIGRGSEAWEAAHPVFVTLDRDWFITTTECELDGVIKRALKQDNRKGRG